MVGLVLLAFAPSSAAAHATLTDPAPRTLANKAGPCGEAGERGTEVAVFEPGETITVAWDETVDHPGHYRIAFDDDGSDDFPLPQTPEDAFPSVLMDQIPDREGGGLYSQEVTLPNYECESCTLQLIQIMTTNVPYNSFYFQCADIALRGTVAPPEGGPDTDGGVTGGCAVQAGSGPGAYLLALLLFGFARRTRSPRRSAS